jgi:hypothetical protein
MKLYNLVFAILAVLSLSVVIAFPMFFGAVVVAYFLLQGNNNAHSKSMDDLNWYAQTMDGKQIVESALTLDALNKHDSFFVDVELVDKLDSKKIMSKKHNGKIIRFKYKFLYVRGNTAYYNAVII